MITRLYLRMYPSLRSPAGPRRIGDKTQIATIGLAARFENFYSVVAGTTLGLMLANVPALLIGHARLIASG